MNEINRDTQEFNYFEFRNVKPDFYATTVLPAYMYNVLPKNKEARVLDVGCGYGQMMRAFLEEGYHNVDGIDISDEAVAFGQKEGLNIKKISDIKGYNVEDTKKYDFILMSHVLEHLPKSEMIETLRHIKMKLLAPKGGFLILVPNAQSNTNCYWAYEDFTHTTLFTSGSIYYVLRAGGFSNVEFLDIDGFYTSKGYKKMIKKLLLNLYKANLKFWNKITTSYYHRPSPLIFTYEIKAYATND